MVNENTGGRGKNPTAEKRGSSKKASCDVVREFGATVRRAANGLADARD